jgi:hypothetical protein
MDHRDHVGLELFFCEVESSQQPICDNSDVQKITNYPFVIIELEEKGVGHRHEISAQRVPPQLL